MVLHDTFTITRHLDVPPGDVFTAFADVAIRRRWFRSPGKGATHELDFRVGGGETTSSTFMALDSAPERLAYRSRYIDIVDVERIVYGYEAVVDGEVRWTSLVTVQLDAEADGTRLQWTEQVTFVRYTGDGSADLAHVRGGTALQLNGLDAALTSEPRRYPIPALPRTGRDGPQAIIGTAAGVPFTALPPIGGGPAPLVVTWHMMDAPCTDAAFAAALPLAGVAAWRVHLGMPWCGPRAYPEGYELSRRDPMMLYVDPVVRQAVDEFPAALADLRTRFPLADAPVGVVGASLGGAVALTVTASGVVPVTALALVNAAIRASSVVAVVSELSQRPYPWDASSRAAADRLDFVTRAADLGGTALLVVSGDEDFPTFRADAAALAAAVPGARLTTVPGLAHPLAERPGDQPAPQTPQARSVDDAITAWFTTHLAT